MAITNNNSPSKTEVYESLHLICQATQQITDHLERLRSLNVLSGAFADINKTAALQLRAEIATSAVHSLASREIEEAHRHEQRRLRMERKLTRTEPKRQSRRK